MSNDSMNGDDDGLERTDEKDPKKSGTGTGSSSPPKPPPPPHSPSHGLGEDQRVAGHCEAVHGSAKRIKPPAPKRPAKKKKGAGKRV
jgi:hypothetical protein